MFFIGNSCVFVLVFYVSFYFVDASSFCLFGVPSLVQVFVCFVFFLRGGMGGGGGGGVKRKNRVINLTITTIVHKLTKNINLTLL